MNYPYLNKKQWKKSMSYNIHWWFHIWLVNRPTWTWLGNALGLWGIKHWLLQSILKFSNGRYYRSIAVTPSNEEWNLVHVFDLFWFCSLMGGIFSFFPRFYFGLRISLTSKNCLYFGFFSKYALSIKRETNEQRRWQQGINKNAREECSS